MSTVPNTGGGGGGSRFDGRLLPVFGTVDSSDPGFDEENYPMTESVMVDA